MTGPVVALALVGLMAALSLAAARRLTAPRLPMQWGLRGQVNWTAPRRLALGFTPAPLGFTPALAAAVVGLAWWGDPAAPLGAIAGGFLVAHLLHLGLLLRWR